MLITNNWKYVNGKLILCLSMVFNDQFEGNDDPLDKTTTAEATRTLTEFYRSSHYSYSAREKVDEMSKLVSILCWRFR